MGFDRSLTYRMTYSLASEIVVVSKACKHYMTSTEGIPGEKIIHINLCYDFALYPKPSSVESVRSLIQIQDTEVLIVDACRFVTYKRPDLLIDLVGSLRDHGIKAGLILLGRGDLEQTIRESVRKKSLCSYIYMPGYVSNPLDYLSLADFVVHPSVLESSCVLVKEAGLLGKPVIACRGVGDFDEIIRDGENGFLVDPPNFVDESASIITNLRNSTLQLTRLGSKLHKDILEKFSISKNIGFYDRFLDPK